MDYNKRVVVLVDMDCFYCQVEENLNPQLEGKPIAVVQYNQWKGGGIIAVNYPARDKGVTRHMRGADAKKKCPELQLVSVPCQRGKADLTKYRDAGKRVADVLQTFTSLLERASVDEAYLDITEAVNKRIELQYVPNVSNLPNTHVAGFDKDVFVDNVKDLNEGDLKLCIGGVIAEEIREAVYKKTGYKCSAGIAHNKILAKLSCGLHKPNQQTILPQCGVDELYKNLPIRKIKSLGGKFGEILGDDLGISTMAELKQFDEKDLIQRYDEKTGSWLYNIARGIDVEPVTVRLVSKSIGCCKKFPGRTALITFDDVSHWINDLSEELAERLAADIQENNRKAKQMVVSFAKEINRKDVHSSRTHPLNSYESEKIAADMLNIINKNCMQEDGSYCIKFMGVSAGKFEDNKKTYDLTSFFNKSNESNKNLPASSTPKRTSNILSFVTKDNDKMQQLSLEENSLTMDFGDILENDSIDEEIKTNIDDRIFLNKTPVIDIKRNDIVFNTNFTSPDADFKKLIHETNLNGSNDSITEEITPRKEPVKKQSYFSTFFDNITTPSTSKDRNFDTSKNLEESFIEITEENENKNNDFVNSNNNDLGVLPLEINIDRESPILTDRNNQSHFKDPQKQLCPECNKEILLSEMPSHLDYHFALKIVKEEAHLYKENKTNNILSKPIKPVKNPDKNGQNKKNKRKPESHCNKLALFLASAKEDIEGPTKTCPECNKKIPSASFMDHLDYHAAKKLHSELNSIIPKLSVKVAGNNNKGKGAIMSYFKRN
ncbi:DNA polymerase eta [Onthophagus taurus]|uniref:DNA polymerase eta n=1 Tax=Onthophagus taurus TaxID=166361 RepID=UPI0039BDF323